MKRISLFLLAFVISFSQIAHAQSNSDMLEKSISAVVTVAVFKTDIANKALGFRGEGASDAAYEKALDMSGSSTTGSGFVIDMKGKKYVITNAHVVQTASEEKGSLYVYSINRNKYEVKVLGGDSFYDLAVLEFVDAPKSEVTTIKFSSKNPRIGERVFAIGNPLGQYPYSVSDGIISAKNRVQGGLTGKFGFLQSTATVIWGNSGGPLVNESGEVVGINTRIAFADSPMGESVWQPQINFALESELSQRLIDDIINNNGLVRRAFLGLEIVQNYDFKKVGFYDPMWVLRDEVPVISAVIPGSPAFNVLKDKVGAVINAINGVEVRNLEEVLGEMERVKTGTTVTINIFHNGKKEDVKFKAAELSTNALEDLALFVMSRNKDIKLNATNSISFEFNKNDAYAYENKGDKGQYQRQQARGSDNATKRYFVVAAGMHTDGYTQMWRISKLSDLGAALRLTGLIGRFDFYSTEANDPKQELQLYRYHFSGKESVLASTLWY
jgi:S1-C subfamily serine protease